MKVDTSKDVSTYLFKKFIKRKGIIMRYFKEGDNYLTEMEVISAYKEDYVVQDTQMPFRFNVDGLPPEYMRTFESWIEWQLERGTYIEVSVVDFIRFKFETCGLVKYLTSETARAGYEDIVSLTIKNSTVSASDLYEFFSHIRRQMCPNTDEDEFFSNSGLSILHKYINSDIYKEIQSLNIIVEMRSMLEETVLWFQDDIQKLKFNYWMLTSVLMRKWFREQDQIDVWEDTVHVRCIDRGIDTGLEFGKDYRAVEDSYFHGTWHIYDVYDNKFRGKFLKDKFEEMEEESND